MSHLDEGQLASLFDDELEPEAKRAAEAHLSSCAECRALWEETRALAAEADRLVGTVELPPAVRSRIAPMPPGPASSPAETTRRPLPWRTLAWAASVMLAVGLGYSLRGAARETTDVAAAPRTNQPVLAERADKSATPPAAEPAAAPTVRRDEKSVAADRVDAGRTAPPPDLATTQPAAPAAGAAAAPSVTGNVALSQAEAEPRAARGFAAPKSGRIPAGEHGSCSENPHRAPSGWWTGSSR